jgi:hypothetical protein
MNVQDRLFLVYLLTVIFGLIVGVINTDSCRKSISETIIEYHESCTNTSVYITLICVILFYILISVYDFFTKR